VNAERDKQEEAFDAALRRAKRRKQPVIALRPDGQFPDELDDIVVCNVDVHMEAMSDNEWWLCCYFANGERLTLWINKSKQRDGPARLVVSATEIPEYLDWDDLYAEHYKT
jgi:hypothetical protein